MNQIDSLKCQLVLSDCIKRLSFLGNINIQDEASSELAGFEISKLLSSQRQLESQYAELIQTRSTLTGIANKTKLEEIQKKIQELAKKLKESTKKLCRLFKENPDIVADKKKIIADRADLISQIESLYGAIQVNQYNDLQENIIKELSDQDLLRKLMVQEKDLVQSIKDLKNEKQQEQKDLQNEQVEKQKYIQMQKDKLVYKTKKAEMKTNYQERECLADEGTQRTILDYKVKELEAKLNTLRSNGSQEALVHQQLVAFLQDKESQLQRQADELSKQYDDMKNDIDQERETLITKITEDKERLRDLRERQQKENDELRENEKREKEKNDNQVAKELKQIAVNNAIQYLQMKYAEWKEAGGGKKKKKKGGKKKKSKKKK